MIAGLGMVAAGFVLKHVKVLMGKSVVVVPREGIPEHSDRCFDWRTVDTVLERTR